MRGILIIFRVIFFSLITECSPPVLNVPNTWVFEVDLNKTESEGPMPLRMTCMGDQNLTWETVVPNDYYSVEKNITSSGQYYSSLTIPNPFAEDTGEFTCRNQDGLASSTYVYIFDGLNGFVSTKSLKTIKVSIGDPIKLDCRTTHPKIKVSVFKNKVQNVTAQFEVDRYYRFRKLATVLQENGFYHCVEDRFQTESTFLVNIEPINRSLKPLIEEHANSYYIVGIAFELNCSVPMLLNKHPSLHWVLPNHRTASYQRTFQKNLNSEKSGSIVRTLFIQNPTMKDSGLYTCVSIDGTFRQNDSTYIKIQRSLQPFVKFSTSQDSGKFIMNVQEGETLNWVLKFTAYPGILTYQFYDNFNKEIDSNQEKFYTELTYQKGMLLFRMMNVTAEDLGNYSVVLSQPSGQLDTRWAMFFVNATPKVEIRNKTNQFHLFQSISLYASILAFDSRQPPNVFWWHYHDCPQGINSCNRQNRTELLHTLRSKNGPPNRFETFVKVKNKISGHIECEVRNGFGIATDEIPFVVYDKRSQFYMSLTYEEGATYLEADSNYLKNLTIIEGDRIFVKCFSLDFLYTNLNLNVKGEDYNCSSTLSSGRCFEVEDMSLSDSQAIECSAVELESKIRQKLTGYITVKEKKKPELLPSSNVSISGETITVKSGKPFILSCHIEGVPFPEITWFKDGVNIEEIPRYVDNEERVFLLQSSQVLEFKFAHKDYEGQYLCKAENRVGSVLAYATLIVEGSGLSTLHWVIVALGIIFIFCLCMIVMGLILRVKKESRLRKELRQNQLYLFEKGNIGDLNTECTIDEQAELLPYDKAYEVEKERIKLGKQLGFGAFGRVMLAEVDGLEVVGRKTKVAVKMCKDGADMAHLRALTLELKIMVHLGRHLNIVNLMGAYTSNMKRGDLWILVEYCKYGNILKFIQRQKNKFINQIDVLTGCIDPHASMQSYAESTRSSHGFSRVPTYDVDGCLDKGTQKILKPLGRNLSNVSSPCSSQSSRPGLYVGNPSYASTSLQESEQEQESEKSIPSPSQKEQPAIVPYVLASQLPSSNLPMRLPSTTSDRSSEGVYHHTHFTEITELSSPFSPASTVSGEFSFDSHGNICPGDSGSIPGVSVPLTTMDLVCWSWQVANGMEYLSRRKVLHGDLAARNLLLAENNVVKISDFGLSRDIYKKDVYMKKGDEIMPIKWMAPEAIQQKVFSIQSDVWAFGITMWELFTLGNNPYPGIPLNQEFTRALENGMRMEKPKYATQELYSIMLKCWDQNPVERPNFSLLSDQLSRMLSPESRENYLSMNDSYIRKNEEWMEFKEDYLNMVTSPDFQNLCPANDHSYIEMQNMTSLEKVTDQPGYLDMRSVRSTPPPDCDSIFSPRLLDEHQIMKDKNVFTFSEVKPTSTNDDQQRSPCETSSLLSKNSPPPEENSNPEISRSESYHENNNVNKIDDLNRLDSNMYQNISNVMQDRNCSKDSNEILYCNKNKGTSISFSGRLASSQNYVNTADLV